MAERPPLLPDLFRMIVKMLVGGVLIIGLVSCGIASIAGAGASAGAKANIAQSKVLYGEEDSENAILRVDILGPILTHKPEEDGNFFSSIQLVTYGYEIKEQLLDAAENDDIKAVMMFVTTPGGSIVGSQAIHEGVLAVQEAGKPVVAYIDTMSASGGVWSTAAADRIFADNGSLIGSVGVNFGSWLYYEDPVALDGGIFFGGVETRGGVKAEFLGAGLGKDLGNPWRPLTEREKTLLEASAQHYYGKFLDHVVKYRGMDRTRLVEEYGAMIFADELALERGYIDGLNNYQDTLKYIAGEIGAQGDDWKLVSPPEVIRSPFEQMFGAGLAAISGGRAEAAQRARVCAELKTGPVAMLAHDLNELCGL